MQLNNVVIVGGGTAGWLTALYADRLFPLSKITVVASSEIGILGAGEGTTVDFIRFLDELDIPISDIIKHANGTIKSGIKFSNWNGDGNSYFHSFLIKKYIDDINMYKDEIHEGNNLDEVQFTSASALRDKVLYKKGSLENVCSDALHFDANLLARYLEGVGVNRGIKLIDEEVSDIVSDSDGYISSLVMKSGNSIDAAFVFDCTGFKRLIIGNFYKGKWHSYAGSLPVNRAMPFFISNQGENLPPYTEAIAMKHGWMWKIPTQGRYGCGYVFDDAFASDDDIKQEVEEYLGHSITSPRMFSFNAGCYENVWIKNCIAIGLSSGFTEPLEATSIWVSIQTLELINHKINGILERDLQAIADFNGTIRNMNEEVVSFLHFHYLTDRQDSKFWKTFSDKTKTPEMVRNLSEIAATTLPTQRDINYITMLLETRTSPNYIQTFDIADWYTIGAGTKFFKSNFEKPLVDKISYKRMISEKITELISHMDYLEILRNEN